MPRPARLLRRRSPRCPPGRRDGRLSTKARRCKRRAAAQSDPAPSRPFRKVAQEPLQEPRRLEEPRFATGAATAGMTEVDDPAGDESREAVQSRGGTALEEVEREESVGKEQRLERRQSKD